MDNLYVIILAGIGALRIAEILVKQIYKLSEVSTHE